MDTRNVLVAAGSVALLTALVHSVLGEMLIFRHLRTKGLVPTMTAPPLTERHVRILWATWHLASLFGFSIAAVLLQMAFTDSERSLRVVVLLAVIFAHMGGAILVLVSTKGRHPGWIALLLIAVLTGLALRAA